MISFTLARKYARALLEIGLRAQNYAALGKDLEKMAGLLEAHKEMKAILISSAYPAAIRKGIAQEVGERLGLSPSTVDFLNLLIERERMDHFFEITRAYEALSDEVAKRLRATLITAMELSSELVAAIKSQLESATGKEVILSLEKDPSLIGGVLTRMGNIIYDGSLKTQLFKVRENLYKE